MPTRTHLACGCAALAALATLGAEAVPSTWSDELSEQQTRDLVAYLRRIEAT